MLGFISFSSTDERSHGWMDGSPLISNMFKLETSAAAAVVAERPASILRPVLFPARTQFNKPHKDTHKY